MPASSPGRDETPPPDAQPIPTAATAATRATSWTRRVNDILHQGTRRTVTMMDNRVWGPL